MYLTLKDFDNLLLSDKNKIKKVDDKLKNLVEKVTKKLDYFSGIYKYQGRTSRYISKSEGRDVFINFQINSEDLSIEFQINVKRLILKFVNNANVKVIHNMKKLGDTEVVIWDKKKKVCKLYPEYIDEKTMEFLLNKIKCVNNPILKFRKIYSRSENILRTNKLENDVIKTIKQMEVFFRYL